MFSFLCRVFRVGRGVLAFCWLAVAAHAASPQEPFAGVDDKWRHYQSPNFELFSRATEFDSRTLLFRLEVLRALLKDKLHLEDRAPMPVTIYYFSTVRDFRAHLPERFRRNDSYRASYRTDVDRGIMLLAPTLSEDAGHQLALSSYVQHLFRMAGGSAPLWLRTGFAHLFETLEVQQERVIFGRPHPGRVQELRDRTLMPLESLMGIDEGDPLFTKDAATTLYFAQSWAVVHYWYLGQHKLPRDGLNTFVAFATGTRGATAAQVHDAFREQLGMEPAAMNTQIDRYVATGRYSSRRLPLPKVASQDSYGRRNVMREEIRERLGEVALRTTQSPAGKFALLDAVGRNPANTRALEALSADSLREGNADLARKYWQQAVEAGTTNPAIYAELAKIEGRRWLQHFDYHFRFAPEVADRLRHLLVTSLKAAPRQTEAYEMLAWVEACAPGPSIANVNLVQSRFKHLDDKAHTLLALALVRLRLNDRVGAEQLLNEVEEFDANLRTLQAVETTKAILEGRPPRRLEKPEAPTLRPKLNLRSGALNP